ncbi:hypothetical protein B0H19DRAFT_1061606 [Mycena capillaripes]|nr:hypothetical protein B0H19DRAFT_1061606 [Mycena capillaripes]
MPWRKICAVATPRDRRRFMDKITNTTRGHFVRAGASFYLMAARRTRSVGARTTAYLVSAPDLALRLVGLHDRPSSSSELHYPSHQPNLFLRPIRCESLLFGQRQVNIIAVSADGFGLQNGWQTWYTVSGFNKRPGDSPEGDSFHLTSLNGAEVSVEFYGNALYLYGIANASFEVVLDNITESFSGTAGADLLFSKEGMVEKNHTVPAQVFYDNSDSALSYSGNWTSKTVQGIPNNTVNAPFHSTSDAGAGMRMNLTNVVAVTLYASTNFGHQLYSVSLDDGVPQNYNASTFWLVANTVIFFQSGLNPNVTHTLNLIDMSEGGTLTLSSVTAYQINPPASRQIQPL